MVRGEDLQWMVGSETWAHSHGPRLEELGQGWQMGGQAEGHIQPIRVYKAFVPLETESQAGAE